MTRQEIGEATQQYLDSISLWGIAIFGSITRLKKWLKEPLKNFGYLTPSELLKRDDQSYLVLVYLQHQYNRTGKLITPL